MPKPTMSDSASADLRDDISHTFQTSAYRINKWLKKMGQGQRVDELVLSMKRAAETAMPMAKDMLLGPAKSMSVGDAKTILQGGNTAATEYFSRKTREPPSAPVVRYWGKCLGS